MTTLFLAELKRRWRMVKSYPMEDIASTLILAILFYGVYLSARFLAGPTVDFGDRLSSIVVGYASWMIILQAFGGIAGDIQEEAKAGTLQQLVMSSFGTRRVFLIRAVTDLTVSVVILAVTLSMIVVLTGARLVVPLSAVFPAITLLLGSIGLGFMVAALTLTFKRIRMLLGMCNFGLMFLVMTPLEQIGGLAQVAGYLLPLAPSVGVLRDLVAQQSGFDPAAFAIALANGALYFLLGLRVFGAAQRRAIKNGSIAAF